MEERKRRSRPYTQREQAAILTGCNMHFPRAKITFKRKVFALLYALATLVLCFLLARAVVAKPFLVTDGQPIAEAGIRYEIQINGGEWTPAARLEDGAFITLREDLEPLALPDGDYTFIVRACNIWECGPASDPLSETKSAPGKPATPRLTAE